MEYRNLINVSARPEVSLNDSYTTNKYNVFCDSGAWHGYYLPKYEDKDLYGGFLGPLIVAEEYPSNLSECISKIRIFNNATNEYYKLEEAKNVKLEYYPGKLFQSYNLIDFTLDLELIFSSNRSALIRYKIKNISKESLNLKISFKGNIFNKYIDCSGNKEYDAKLSIKEEEKGISVNFSNIRDKNSFFSTEQTKFAIKFNKETKTLFNKEDYTTNIEGNINLDIDNEYEVYCTQSYTFTDKEYTTEDTITNNILLNPTEYFEINKLKWDKYKNSISYKNEISNYKECNKVAMKCIQTLITNYRSSAGALKNGGVVPSTTYHWFNGLWAWDSFKQVVAVCKFDTEIAKENVRAIFDYQIKDNDDIRPQDKGAIIDCVFYNKDSARGGDGGNWNERDSKPPLSAWAVWNIYKEEKNTEFLKEMYEKLVDYQNWWYTNRDTDKNGIAEYGGLVHDKNNSDEAIIQAAAWESGMDNAPRFDEEGYGEDDIGVVVFENKDEEENVIGYSINQESVDLNSYLYAEKIFLSYIAKELQKYEEEVKFIKEAEYIRDYVREYMFDEETGYFYDLQIDEKGSKKLLVNRGKGIEGVLPLWAGLASDAQAKMVVENLIDENKFNTYMPFPTVSKDSKAYSPNKYWRGPVWLDQALFGVEGMIKYGYREEAIKMTEKLFKNAEGLMQDRAIRENYNPENGEGLHTTNFSWSASVYYLLYKNILNNEGTTTI
ncbi:MAG: MGH1-like glycoside hydrolase domain-containing protein [Paraclostridium sp.]